MFLVFVFLSLCFSCLVGVFGDEVKSVSVIEGHSVTLYTDITEIQTNDVIEWRFGPQETLIARINKAANKTFINETVLDGIFRDRLQLNNQTGDLIITNITTQHTGLYQMIISSEQKTMSYRFNVTVNEQSLLVVICCAAVGSLMIVASVVIFWIYRKHKNTEATIQSGGEEITYTDPTFSKRQTHKPRAAVEDKVVYAGVNKKR